MRQFQLLMTLVLVLVLVMFVGCSTYRVDYDPQEDGTVELRVFGRGTTTLDRKADGSEQVVVSTDKANAMDKVAMVGTYVLDAASGALSRMGINFEE